MPLQAGPERILTLEAKGYCWPRTLSSSFGQTFLRCRLRRRRARRRFPGDGPSCTPWTFPKIVSLESTQARVRPTFSAPRPRSVVGPHQRKKQKQPDQECHQIHHHQNLHIRSTFGWIPCCYVTLIPVLLTKHKRQPAHRPLAAPNVVLCRAFRGFWGRWASFPRPKRRGSGRQMRLPRKRDEEPPVD